MLQIFSTSLLIILFSVASLFPQERIELNLEYEKISLPFGFTSKKVKGSPKIILVLSGGGARGLAQLGVIKAFEKFDVPFDMIVGTSMGSIVGGLYAAGYSTKQLDSIVSAINWTEVFSLQERDRKELFVDQKITEDRALFALRFDGFTPILPTALNTGQRVSNLLNLLVLNAPIHVNNKNFDHLLYPYRAVCTDLVSGKTVILQSGSLNQAMRASSSVSLLLSPVKIDSLLLVDGGLVANVPVKVAHQYNPDLIIASDATSPLSSKEELRFPWKIAEQMVSIPMRIITEQNLNKADFIITPDLTGISNTSFNDPERIVDLGEEAADLVLPKFKQIVIEKNKERLAKKEIVISNLTLRKNATKLEKEIVEDFSYFKYVTNRDILYRLQKELEKGYHKNLSAEIIVYPTASKLIVHEELNPTVNKIFLSGNSLISDAQILKILNDLLEKPFNPNKTVDHLIEVMNLYRANGYSLADFEECSFDENTGTLKVSLTEGRINEIIVVGNKKTNADVITRELPIEAGEYFNYNKIEDGLTNLRSTNLFSDIDLIVNKNGGDGKKLTIKVEEKASSLIRFGIRIDNENFTQPSIDIRDENLFGTGTELGAILAGGLRNRTFIIEHKANRVFDTYFTYKIRGFYNFNDVNLYSNDTLTTHNKFSRSKTAEYRQIFLGGSIALGTQVEKFGNLIVEGAFQQDEINNKMDFNDTYTANIASLKFKFTIDSQDKFPYPNSGFFVNGYYQTAQKLFGSELSFTKFDFDYTSFFTIAKAHTISPRFRIGFADETLPLSQHFSLGGQKSFFGFRDYEFRGRQIFLTSIEYRYKLPFDIFFDSYVKFRYDLGSIWANEKQIRFKDLRHGIGATISFDTPLGPADFSVGRAFIIKNTLPKSTISKGPVFFYFTIGYFY